MFKLYAYSAIALLLFAAPGWAAKEKFERTKPHVNVGTINLDDESLSLHLGLVSVEDQVAGGSSPTDACGGAFDIRVVDADDPAGVPLEESTGLRAVANGRISFNYTGGSVPEDVLLVIVARDMDNVKSKGCLLRGRVDIVDNSGGGRRSIPIRPEDFVKTKNF